MRHQLPNRQPTNSRPPAFVFEQERHGKGSGKGGQFAPSGKSESGGGESEDAPKEEAPTDGLTADPSLQEHQDAFGVASMAELSAREGGMQGDVGFLGQVEQGLQDYAAEHTGGDITEAAAEISGFIEANQDLNYANQDAQDLAGVIGQGPGDSIETGKITALLQDVAADVSGRGESEDGGSEEEAPLTEEQREVASMAGRAEMMASELDGEDRMAEIENWIAKTPQEFQDAFTGIVSGAETVDDSKIHGALRGLVYLYQNA